MTSESPLALWIIRPPGAGKTYFAARYLSSRFHMIDPDAELETEMQSIELPLDTRIHTPMQSAAFAALRRSISDRVWGDVPTRRSEGVWLAFQTPGDKPHLLRDEVHAGIQAGYRNLGVGLRCRLETCRRRNRARPRVLPDAVIEKAWRAFEHNLAAQVYDEILGSGFAIVNEDTPFEFTRFIGRPR